MYNMHAQISSQRGKRERLSEACWVARPPAAGREERRRGERKGEKQEIKGLGNVIAFLQEGLTVAGCFPTPKGS